MALSRLVCAFVHHSLVTVLTRCGLPLPVYFLADEKHSRCLAEKVYLPTIVCGRVMWHLGYTEAASTVAFTQSYQEFQRTALQQDPAYHSILKFFSLAIRAALILQVLHSIGATHNHGVAFG